jgi:HB1, ASXL, restriction endonuclease HTH domain
VGRSIIVTKYKIFETILLGHVVAIQEDGAMTCPELIDVMATEGLWVSPGGKTPASTLYAAIGRSIKDEEKASAFRKTERGKFEAKD